MGSISTRLTERFSCRHPFASAGMAFAGGTADLALGVCAGGGIGAMGVGFTRAEPLRAIIHEIRAATDAPFNINFITCFVMAAPRPQHNPPCWQSLPTAVTFPLGAVALMAPQLQSRISTSLTDVTGGGAKMRPSARNCDEQD